VNITFMDVRSVEFITAACAAQLRQGSPAARVARVCTDSRQAQRGDLFVALAGERFDGHDFVASVARTVAAVLVQRGKCAASLPESCAVLEVESTRQALGRLAQRYRQDFSLPVLAVAGSNGKTTTKELLAAVLGKRLKTLRSEASFNNDIGVPLTLLNLESTHQAAVLETGTNHPGELEPLLRMIAPTHGVLTSIGREHLEFFGDLSGVTQEEGCLAEAVPAGGVLFVNGDEECTATIINRTRARVVRVGIKAGNDWRLRSVRLGRQGTTFRLESPAPEFDGEYRLKLLGRHQAVNALFALAAAAELGVSRAEAQAGLAECQPARMRLQLWNLHGVHVLDDAYNANADSMAAALQTLKELPCRGRRVAVLGDMAELGAHSPAAHEEVGRRAAELGVSQLFAVGKMAPVVAQAARNAGLNRVLEFAEVEAAAAAVKSFIKAGDVLLLKASRIMRLERITELLRRAENGKTT
jgi:UDP-N-acetylmuramoyl-tripeptide--D-alanyl-D-alanine ligase